MAEWTYLKRLVSITAASFGTTAVNLSGPDLS